MAKVTATDAQIDQLVYGLYGLTDEEIKIVEEATGARQRKRVRRIDKRGENS